MNYFGFHSMFIRALYFLTSFCSFSIFNWIYLWLRFQDVSLFVKKKISEMKPLQIIKIKSFFFLRTCGLKGISWRDLNKFRFMRVSDKWYLIISSRKKNAEILQKWLQIQFRFNGVQSICLLSNLNLKINYFRESVEIN